MSYVILTEAAEPEAPPTGKVNLYCKTDGIFYYKADDGIEHEMNSSVVEKYGAVSVNFEETTKPKASASFNFLMPYDMTVPANCTGSTFYNKTNPSGTVTVSIKKNGTEFATLGVSTSGVATYASSGTELATGDRVTFSFPAVQDSTWSGVVITLRGVR